MQRSFTRYLAVFGAFYVGCAVLAWACVVPQNGMVITTDTTFCGGVYTLPDGVTVAADHVTLAGEGTTLTGQASGWGVAVLGRAGVTIRDLTIRRYAHGIHVQGCTDPVITRCVVEETPKLPEGQGIFIDIFAGPNGPSGTPYAHAIWVQGCVRPKITHCTATWQQSGVSVCGCTEAYVADNELSYNTGWGIYLYDTHFSTIERNRADYCTREYYGWSGGDAASLIMVLGSSYNQITDNSFVGGGDGIFIVGMAFYSYPGSCHDNYVARNDCSKSPNNGIEATFCDHNTFEDNILDYSHYGFWIGYSIDSVLRRNRGNYCYASGLANEHGHNNLIEENAFNYCGTGIELWTDDDTSLVSVYPDRKNSYGHLIYDNTLIGNGVGIACTRSGSFSSYGQTIERNVLRGNGQGIWFDYNNTSSVRTNFITGSTSQGFRMRGNGSTLADNYFAGNVADVYSSSSSNTWYAAITPGPSIVGGPWRGGNYWAAYTGSDLDGDGLGDTAVPFGVGDARPLVWSDPDCNRNGVADAAEPDCDGNGVPDDCDIATEAADCNGNGRPDACDMTEPETYDCDGNGVIDACQVLATYTAQLTFTPFGYGGDYVGTLAAAPRPAGEVVLDFAARANVSGSNRNIGVRLDDTPVGIVYLWTSGQSCTTPVHDRLVVSAGEARRVLGGGGDVELRLLPSSYVSATYCAQTEVVVTVTYPYRVGDVNGDGLPDTCLCPGDMNCDGQVTFADIDRFVAAFGYPGGAGWPYPCGWGHADCNGDRAATFADIDPFAGRLGAVCP